MTDEAELFASQALPGWYGKLPGMGDFAHRRLPESFREPWDQWLQAGLAQMREQHAGWIEAYLQASVWCFVLGRGTADPRAWLGVLMPSVDLVGRYFPFTVAVEVPASEAELRDGVLAHARQWWARVARAALDALDRDLDAAGFEALLQSRFADQPDAGIDVGSAALALPLPGTSLWLSDPAGEAGIRVESLGLPRGEQFGLLFGCPPEAAPRHATEVP